ncbi:hypothetical protein [Dickeya oryzae]
MKSTASCIFEFSARLPVIGDTVDALAVTQDARGTTTGPAASLFYRVAVTSSVLTLAGVDAEKNHAGTAAGTAV